MINLTDKGFILIKMVKSILVNGSMIYKKEMELKHGLMVFTSSTKIIKIQILLRVLYFQKKKTLSQIFRTLLNILLTNYLV